MKRNSQNNNNNNNNNKKIETKTANHIVLCSSLTISKLAQVFFFVENKLE